MPELKNGFKKIRNSGRTKDFLVFLLFVAVAAVFWFIITLNDEVQESIEVTLEIGEVPDSVTFISVPPAALHVIVKDRGMNLIRHKLMGNPTLKLDFREFVDGEYMRVTHNDLVAALRDLLGQDGSVTSVSPDSLKLLYTKLPGKKVPVELVYDATVVPGMVLGTPRISTPEVEVFSAMENDTVSRVYTEKAVVSNIDKNVTLEIPLKRIPGRRIEPDKVNVTFTVESLVKKEVNIPITAEQKPYNTDVLFFPSKVKVTYYVPISHYEDTDDQIKVDATLSESLNSATDKVGLKIVSKAPYVQNIELQEDSVEYNLIRNN